MFKDISDVTVHRYYCRLGGGRQGCCWASPILQLSTSRPQEEVVPLNVSEELRDIKCFIGIVSVGALTDLMGDCYPYV